MFSYPFSFTFIDLRPYFDSIDSFLALDLFWRSNFLEQIFATFRLKVR